MTIDREREYREMAVRGKYQRLYTHLRTLQSREWRTSFGEIESIIGFELPASARLHRPWWANQSHGNGHSQSLAWSVAGWETAEVDMKTETLLFRRRELPQTDRRLNLDDVWPVHSDVIVACGSESQARGHVRGEDVALLTFIDTNVLVYSRILEAPQHEMARAMLEHALQDEEPLRISRQVVREYLARHDPSAYVGGPHQSWDALDYVNRLVGSIQVLDDGPAAGPSGRSGYVGKCP